MCKTTCLKTTSLPSYNSSKANKRQRINTLRIRKPIQPDLTITNNTSETLPRQLALTLGRKNMPFIFSCSQCGSIIYEDPSPLLQDGSYKSPTYFENIQRKLGTNCTSCGHKLQFPPLDIKVFVPTTEKRTAKKRSHKEQMATNSCQTKRHAFHDVSRQVRQTRVCSK